MQIMGVTLIIKHVTIRQWFEDFSDLAEACAKKDQYM